MDNNKVLPSRKQPIPAGAENFPQRTALNPSQTNGNSPPAIPPSHRQSGSDGSNGPAPPYFPSSKKD
jgi:hypothetical protein